MVPIAGRIMRLTKKAAALLVAAAMVMSMGTTVFAGDGDESATNTGSNAEGQGDKATTSVTYTVSESYEWTVPKSIDFTSVANDTGNTDGKITATVAEAENKVVVKKNVIKANQSLVISALSAKGKDDSKFVIVTNEGASLEYAIYTKASTENAEYNTTPITSAGQVLTVPAGKVDYVSLKFVLTKADASVEKAGSYSDTVTFSASLDPATTGSNSQQG